MAPSAQKQIRDQYASLQQTIANHRNVVELSHAYGEMGKLLMAAQDYLLVWRTCPDCAKPIHSAPIRNLADLGRALNSEGYEYHWCEAKQPEQSAADRLVEALRAVIEGVSI